jgi:hypothetical protein
MACGIAFAACRNSELTGECLAALQMEKKARRGRQVRGCGSRFCEVKQAGHSRLLTQFAQAVGLRATWSK